METLRAGAHPPKGIRAHPDLLPTQEAKYKQKHLPGTAVRTICWQVSHGIRLLPADVVSPWQHGGIPPSPAQATHCPHPMEGTWEVMEQGGSISPLPLEQAVDLDVRCPPCSVGKGAVDRTLPDVGVHTWGTSTHCQGCGGLNIPRIRIPAGSGSAGPALAPSRPWWSHPHPHPSSLSGGAGSPAGPGSGAARPEPSPRDRREHRGDKRSQTTTTTAPLGTSKRRADIAAVPEPAWALRAGTRAGPAGGPRFACAELGARVKWDGKGMGARSRVPCTAMGTKRGKQQLSPRQGAAPCPLCACRVPNLPMEMCSEGFASSGEGQLLFTGIK